MFSNFMKPESREAKLKKIGLLLAENDQYKTMKYGYHLNAVFHRNKTFSTFTVDKPGTLQQIQDEIDSLNVFQKQVFSEKVF